MGKNNHSVMAHDIAYTVSQVNKLSKEEVYSLYVITLLEGGKVFDPLYNQTFSTVGEWATFSVEQDDVEYEEHFYGAEYED
jgi:hypothetical protein